LLIVGGGIAAYKSLELVRRLRERGARVRVVMTAAAKEFVTPLAFVSLANEKVYDDLFSATDEQEMGHIQLSRDADLIVVAPATAHLLARAARGLCDDLATTLLLATDTRVLYAPAMNVRMWLHPATQRNVSTLHGDGALVCRPKRRRRGLRRIWTRAHERAAGDRQAIETALKQDTRCPRPRPTDRAAARSKGCMSSSPPGPPMSRSIRFATSPTVPQGGKGTPLRRRRRAQGRV
jgi:phosphopantothenoylcysteine decarboxylase/phosphopantothenate--cysteine ligase